MKIYSQENLSEAFRAGENFGALPFSTNKNILNEQDFISNVKFKEIKVFVITPDEEDEEKDHLYWFEAGDEEFKAQAELNETVYTIDEFESFFNNNDTINQNVDVIRFLIV